MTLHHKKKHDFRNSLYHKNHDFRNSLYHGFCLYPIGFHGFWEISGVPRNPEHYDIMFYDIIYDIMVLEDISGVPRSPELHVSCT
jgi:hypothetical protein